MNKNRLRQVRVRKGLTVQEVAQRAGLSQPYVTRLEAGRRNLSVAVAERLATAMEADLSEILGIDNGTGSQRSTTELAEDAIAYTAKPGDLVSGLSKKGNIFPYTVTSSALDALGIAPGDVLIVDISAEAVERIQAMDRVVAQVYQGANLEKTVTVIRQFIPPSLLITNSETKNAIPLHLETDDVAIKGVIVAVHRSLL